jgi:hypothetical protein
LRCTQQVIDTSAMVHFINVLFIFSVAVLPALAAPIQSDVNDLMAREPQKRAPARHHHHHRRKRPHSTRPAAPNAVANGINQVGNVATQIGNVAGRVGSAVSSIRNLFGRDFEDGLFERELLEKLEAREPIQHHPRELIDDELEAREAFYDELD